MMPAEHTPKSIHAAIQRIEEYRQAHPDLTFDQFIRLDEQMFQWQKLRISKRKPRTDKGKPKSKVRRSKEPETNLDDIIQSHKEKQNDL